MKNKPHIFLIIYILLLSTCKLYNTTPLPDIGIPEKFDIKKFNKIKNEFNEYGIENNFLSLWQTAKISYPDSISKGVNEYSESIVEKKHPTRKYLSRFKLFYASGTIKERGDYYNYNHSSIYVGIWEYFDFDGKLISLVDYDKKYKVSYKQAFYIAKKNYGFKQKDTSIELYGDNWLISNIKKGKIGQTVIINTLTGNHEKIFIHQNKNDVNQKDFFN